MTNRPRLRPIYGYRDTLTGKTHWVGFGRTARTTALAMARLPGVDMIFCNATPPKVVP